MTESPQTPDAGDNPTDEELDVEGPNESTQSHQADPRELEDESSDS